VQSDSKPLLPQYFGIKAWKAKLWYEIVALSAFGESAGFT